MKRVSVRFPEDVARLIAEEAERRGISKSRVVVEALIAYGVMDDATDPAPAEPPAGRDG